MKHLYLIGIGGVGTAWLADYALAQGWKVSGSDLTQTGLTTRLVAAGVTIHYGVQPEKIPDDVTEAVASSAALSPSSPSYLEVEELRRRKVPLLKRAEAVGKISREKFTIAVAGTHGKSSTTAMIGWILEKAGLDPTVFVGSSLAAWGEKTRIGQSKYLVLEADEFDRSFHHFSAQIAVLLNLDADHLDYYQDGLPEIEKSFRRFLRNLPVKKGIVVAYGRNSSLRKICRGFSYIFRWYDDAHLWPGIKLLIPGKHMLLNATAAARVAHELGVPAQVIKEALATFPGIGRRFEALGEWNQAQLYDDYAHHPAEIAATLQAAREKFAKQPLTVVFQPHQKARTQHLLKEFGRCFDQNAPDKLILAPIYQVAGREEAISVTSEDIAREIKKNPPKMEVRVAESSDQLRDLVEQASKQAGVLLIMGAGDIRRLVDSWRQ